MIKTLNLPDELAAKVRVTAAKKGKSMNKHIVDVLIMDEQNQVAIDWMEKNGVDKTGKAPKQVIQIIQGRVARNKDEPERYNLCSFVVSHHNSIEEPIQIAILLPSLLLIVFT